MAALVEHTVAREELHAGPDAASTTWSGSLAASSTAPPTAGIWCPCATAMERAARPCRRSWRPSSPARLQAAGGSSWTPWRIWQRCIGRAIVDEPPFSVREGGMIRDGYDEEVDRLRGIMPRRQGHPGRAWRRRSGKKPASAP